MKKILHFHAFTLILTLLSYSSFAQNKDWLIKMQDPDVNFWELQNEFNDYWKNRTDTKGNGYKVFKRWEYINEVRALPDGKLQAPDYVMKEYERYMAEASALKSASGTWAIVGPTAYPSNNTGQPTGMGRINVIAFHPSDANTIFVGSPGGGIWKTTDGGANWLDLSSNMPYLGVSAILIHPSDPNIIYIGSGDRDGNDSPGTGVYKSTDGGATWVQMSSGMGNVTVGMMLMHPSNPNIIIAATKSGIYKTTDAGITWTLKQAGDFRDIKFKPGDPNTMYATRVITPSEFYRSTDNGDTWTQITTPTSGVGSRMVIGVSPANANYVYLVQIKSSDETFKSLLRSTDGGLNFAEQSSTPNIFDYLCDGSGTASQATYDLAIEVDQGNADIVYVASINSWKSTNGGVNWSPVTHWVGSTFAPSDPTANCAQSVHADHHWLVWSPHHSPARLYVGTDGGVYYTANDGNTWTQISSGLSIGQVYKIGQSANLSNNIMAGFQDNGVSSTNNGSTFTTIGGGDGSECVIDYNNANFCYQSTNSNVRRSTTGMFGSYSNFLNGVTGQAAFVAPYMLHRTNFNTMFVGRENVWRSSNVRAIPASSVTWQAISSFGAGATIRLIEQSPANLDIVYISRGTGGGSTVYRSDNANAAANSVVWTAITKPGGLTPTGIKANYTNQNIVYATAGMQVFRSIDKGVTWTNITGNLPALFVNCLALDKDANEGIYIGNQTGVWYKDATMTDWVLFSSGLPPVDVRELEIYYDANPNNSRISAATYGRGVWQSDLIQINTINPSNLAATSISTSQIDLSWMLNPSNNNVLIATSPTTIFGVPADGTAYSSGNTLPGGGTVVYVGNLTNFSHTGLTAGTTYCYKIWSYNGSNQYSSGLPPVCANTFSHNWTGNANTDWFNTGNWGPGTVPTTLDAAYIPAGCPNYPLINAAGATCYHLTIESGASVAMDATTSYTLQVTGDWTNNGTFIRGGGTVEFNGTNALQTIQGTSTTAFNILRVNKGVLDNILEVKSLITLNAAANPLVIISGTFKLSSASTITPFTSSTSLTGGAGFWNNGGTVNSGNLSWTLNGAPGGALLRVSAGTVNVGTTSGNGITYLNNGTLIIEGGNLNIAGRFSPNSGTSVGTYTQSGGTLTVNTVGSTSTTRAPFELNSGVPFTMSGGTIAIRRSSFNVAGDIIISSTTHAVTGGTLQIGDAATPAAQTIRINCTAPVYNLTVNPDNSPTARLEANNLTVKNNVTISGGTLNANNLNLNVGGHWTNNGAFTAGTGTVTFNGTANQNLAGSNATTFNNLTLNNATGLTLSGSVNTTASGVLTLASGVITTGSNRVIIPSSGSVARTSGHIFGNLQKFVSTGASISQTFEIGDAASTNYTPAAVTFANVSVAGDLTAQTVSGDHPQIGSSTLSASKSVNRYWSLTNSGTTFDTYDAVFNFLNTDLDGSVNTSNLICGKYDAPNWTYPTIGTRTANSTQITGVAAFSDFQLGEPGCVNPDVPTLNATVNPTCSGQPTTLSIASGNLNGAAAWQWYSGSCGGTAAGTGTSINVSPTSTTTYYARGEGGCVASPGSCGSISITVNALPTVTCPSNSSVCISAAAYALMGGSPSGGTYSGPGVSAGMFSPATAGTGTHTIIYSYTDGNGCSNSCTFTITVNALPTLTCPSNSSVCISAPAYALTGGSPSGGTYSGPGVSAGMFSPATAGTGTHTITYAYTDGNGCSGSCTFAITVNSCLGYTISGVLLWEHDDATGVGNATVALAGDQSGSVLTPADGTYSFTVTSGSNFTVTPTKSINKLNGVTVADATAIQQHVSNNIPIVDPYKQVAADVNKSNSITTADANVINQSLLGNPAALAQFKTSWRFTPTTPALSIPPWGFSEKITLTGVSGNVPNQNFFGIKTGDVVTAFANPANFGAPTMSGLVLNVVDQWLQAGETVSVAFKANQFDDLTSFQLALKFDVEKLELVDIQPLAALPLSVDNFGTYNLSEGEIRAVWSQAESVNLEESAPVFSLKFNVLQGGSQLSEAIHLEESVLPALAYKSALTESGIVLNFFETTGVGDPTGANSLQLFQNRPNPFNGTTAIGFVLPKESEAQLRIYDVSGRMLLERKGQYPAGRNEEVFDLTNASGVLWYELTTPFGVLTKKMVAVK